MTSPLEGPHAGPWVWAMAKPGLWEQSHTPTSFGLTMMLPPPFTPSGHAPWGTSLGFLTSLLGASESLSKSGSSMTKDSICAAMGPSGSLSEDAASLSLSSSCLPGEPSAGGPRDSVAPGAVPLCGLEAFVEDL